MPEPVRSQLQGFALYNYGRFLINQKKQQEAVSYYIDAAKARIAYYEGIKATADDTELRGAATQVWKIREEWTRSLPDTDIESCPVSEKLFAEVTPLSDPAFSKK